MADSKISNLPTADPLAGTELFAVVQDSETRQATISQVATLINESKVVVSVTYAANTTADLSAYSAYATVILDLTLTGDVTFNITNGTDGQAIKLRCRQDGSGNHIWTSGANLRFSADITSIVLSTGVSKLDYVGFEWNGTDGKADVLAINKGF